MSQRQSKLLWLRDMLENLVDRERQLEWTQDDAMIQVLTESMLRDLDCCRRLCEAIQQRSQALPQAV